MATGVPCPADLVFLLDKRIKRNSIKENNFCFAMDKKKTILRLLNGLILLGLPRRTVALGRGLS